MNKSDALRAVLAALEVELHSVERMVSQTVEEATGAESKAECKYDTRATEASYLAAGQAQRVQALSRVVSWIRSYQLVELSRIGLGALVQVDDDGQTRWLFILPGGAGTRVILDGAKVHVVSPDAPLVQALLGLEEGDGVDFTLGKKHREVEVLALL